MPQTSPISKINSKTHINNLHQQFQNYGRNAREWTRKCALMLPEIARERVWEKKGFGSIYEYAGKLAGMGRSAVDDALRVLECIKDKPELMTVAEQRGINAVRPVATIATVETSKFWAEKASTMGKTALETYVHELRVHNATPEAIQLLPSTKLVKQPSQQELLQDFLTEIIEMALDPEIAAELKKLNKNNDWNSLMKELLESRKRELQREEIRIQEENSSAKEASSRHIPAEIERHILKRSRGVCEFRGCTKRYKILHHTQRFGLEKVHDPQRIVALCTAHERLTHMSLIHNENQECEKWKISSRPDNAHPKFEIDALVMKYRTPK